MTLEDFDTLVIGDLVTPTTNNGPYWNTQSRLEVLDKRVAYSNQGQIKFACHDANHTVTWQYAQHYTFAEPQHVATLFELYGIARR